MKLWEQIIEFYPEINATDNFRTLGIYLKDDGDGIEYVEKWEYSQPLPDGILLGKPSSKK
jgi:hypothetical protein